MKFAKAVLLTIFIFKLSTNAIAQYSYDAALAQKLGADDYGMKKYVMAFLKSGNVQLKDSVKQAELQMAHLKNIGRLAKEGKLVVAGPFMDDQPIRGIYIFNVTTIEEAKKLTETDPAIKSGVLAMELHPWYGAAALMETVNIHKRLERKSITD
ncbi:MAG: YciI family protein [Agriterribacter sp.]